jgi:hypothetical protein
MMKALKRCTAILALFLLSQTVFSQQILNLPLKWQKPRWTNTIDTTSNTNKVWIVFSDRNNNPTYESSKSKTVKKTVNYMEQFYVTYNDGTYLHIFKDGIEAEKYKQLGPNKEDYGWIKIDHVLPNQSCYINEEGVSVKAILLNTTASAKGDTRDINLMDFKKVRFYKDPQLTQITDFECGIYQVFYIYKRFPAYAPHKSFLLGKNPKFSAFDTGNIVGWVDANRLTIWNHRVAVIPNAKPEAYKERGAKGVYAKLFGTEESAKKYGQGQSYDEMDAIWTADSCWPQEKFSPYIPRNPVLWNNKEIKDHGGVIKIGIIGDVTSRTTKTAISKTNMAEGLKDYNEKRASSRRVNILFVVDGTRSMAPYFTGVGDAIRESMEQLQGNTNNSFSFAAAVYRDMGDGDDLVFSSTPLSSNYGEVATWLQKQKALSTQDPDIPEAVNYGITEALRRVSLPVKDENNFVILIGDAGNHAERMNDKTNVAQKQVIDMLFDYNCFFAAFQVYTSPDPAYMTFLKDNKAILNALSLKFYNRDSKKFQSSGAIFKPAPGPWSQDNDRRWSLDNAPFPGCVMQAKMNEQIPPKVLTSQVVKTITSMNDSANDHIKTMQEFMESGDFQGKEITNGQLTFLARLDISPQTLQILADKHVQLFYPGYSFPSNKNLKEPVWQNEILCTTDDMYKIVHVLAKLVDNSKNESELRDNFIDAWKGILRPIIGEQNRSEFEEMRLEEVERLAFGGVGTTKLLDHKLKDFRDPTKVSQVDLRVFTREIENSYKILNSIYQGVRKDLKDKYIWESNDNKYYWIPERLFP